MFELRTPRAAALSVRAALLAVLALIVSVVGFTAPAQAAVIDGAITGVSVRQDTAGLADAVTIDLTWAVGASAHSGDTFTLTLPPELDSFTNGFNLRAPNGQVVAVATVVNDVVTFTLTSYVDTHDTVAGSAFFSAGFADSVQAGTHLDLDFPTSGPTYHDGIDVLDFATPTRTSRSTATGPTRQTRASTTRRTRSTGTSRAPSAPTTTS